MTDPKPHQNQGCLTQLLRILGIKRKAWPASTNEQLPYQVRDDFLSPAEKSFFHVVASVVGKQATVCPKVNLSDIFYVTRPHENMSYRGRIAQKHLDFLLCDVQSMQPILGIELDDSSHARARRQARDEFVDRVFEAAGLPLVRVAVQRSYNTNELAAQLAPYLDNASARPAQSSQSEATTTAAPSAPLCPKCGVPMVVRTATRGEHQGKQFYGCPNYPRCRHVRSIR